MAFTSKNRNKPRKCWDREDDLHDYLKYKNTQNKNQNKFKYFNNLLHKFVIKHPKPDPELIQFTEGSASIVQSHVLRLQEQNRDNNAEENLTEDEVEQNGFLLDYFKPHGQSYVLDIVEDGVLVKYEDEIRTRKRKCAVKRSAAKNGGRSKRGRKRKNMKGACFEKIGEQVDTPSCMEVSVKEEIQDYDDDDDDNVEEIDMMHVDHDQTDNEGSARKVPEFRERLESELNRPYCEEECKKLLQDFNLRKRVQKHKILRGVEKIYEGDHDGKSYHDHNLDLAKQIDAAGDDLPKVLRLLRGFFFWLTNLTDEGAFLPWRVPLDLDLDVLPQHQEKEMMII
ncbi:uncharacterized protein LOC131655480 [Vicia villosa]|uniref:uncharacterized protein LOC131655480 n=1 Tax=Vicia villosa TaxID=3911 RepID=UPI00273A8E84|nr:uncharacterized protein LOC131655480 [Vicia villosa]